MYEKKKIGWSKHLDFFVLDILVLQLALMFSYWFHYHKLVAYDDANYRRFGILMILFSIVISFVRESYHNVLKRGNIHELKETFIHVTTVLLGDMVMIFMLKLTEIYSRRVFILMWITGLAGCYIARTFWKQFLKYRIAESKKCKPVLLISSSDVVSQVISSLEEVEFKDFRIQGVLLLDHQDWGGRMIGGIEVSGDLDGLTDYLRQNVIDEIFVCTSGKHILPDARLQQCIQMGITVHNNLGCLSADSNKCVSKFGKYTVLSSSMKMVSYRQLVIKRAMDIVGGLVGLLLTGILCIFVVPAIKLTDPGPAFFKQVRIGKNGRQFEIYKFRSMYRDAEERKKELLGQNEMNGLMFKMEDDPRILKGIGQFIRKTSIDEFPQFWNVLKGDMSLVGTRPPTLEEYEQYDNHHVKRVSIKPGITGLWQASGRNEIKDFEEVVSLDTQYILNWSVFLDIKILFKTIGVVLKREGAG